MNSNQKINWDKLKTFHRKTFNTQFHRNKFIDTKYKIFKFILNKKLKITNTQYIYQQIINKNINQRFILTNNNFHYNLESDIKHLLLWINPEHPANKEFYEKSINLNNKDIFVQIVEET